MVNLEKNLYTSIYISISISNHLHLGVTDIFMNKFLQGARDMNVSSLKKLTEGWVTEVSSWEIVVKCLVMGTSCHEYTKHLE